MLAQRFTAARRATSGLSGVANTSSKASVPLVCRRWKSAKSKEKDVNISETSALDVPKSKVMRRGLSYGNENVGTWDGQRMKAGSIQLVPHKHEPDACIFVVEGDEQWLDNHKGALDNDGKRRRLIVPSFWLRDACQCPKCVNPETRQRTFNTFALERPRLVKSDWEKRGYMKSKPWEGGIMPKDFLPNDDKAMVLRAHWSDGHVGEYSKRFVRKMLDTGKLNNWGTFITWDNQIWNDPAEAAVWGDEPLTYEEVMNGKYKSGMFRVTDTLEKWGVITIEGVPHKGPEATQKLLEEIGPIRNTHYGGFYDFTADMSKNDTAYTNQALAPHTDTTYFTEPAALQAFHVLSHTKGPNGPAEGGETVLADGIRAAVLLEKADPKAFKTLCEVRIPWFSNGNRDACIMPVSRFPVIQMHPETGEIMRVRWNNDDRGVVPLESSVEWYSAARKFHALVNHPAMQIRFQLKPGTILITNNWRVLHGRTAFTGNRRVCGGYINRDDWESRWRLAKGTNDYHTGYLAFQDDAAVSSYKVARAARINREKYGWNQGN